MELNDADEHRLADVLKQRDALAQHKASFFGNLAIAVTSVGILPPLVAVTYQQAELVAAVGRLGPFILSWWILVAMMLYFISDSLIRRAQ